MGAFKLSVDHPYDPERAIRVYRLCQKHGLFDYPGVEVVEPRPATQMELAEVHTYKYLDALRRSSEGEFDLSMLEYGLGTEDCPIAPGLLDFLSLCAGATLEAVERVGGEGFSFAFNPLGGFHHAGRARAEGFCYINDVCLAAGRWARAGLKVMVIDIDAHHGNGTQDFFYDDPRVLTVSIHESGETLYPFGGKVTEIGTGIGLGCNVNVPLAAESDDEVFDLVFNSVVPPLIEAFKPDRVIGVMGVDTFSSDPLTHLRMTNNSYLRAVRTIREMVPRWIALGAGGYNADNVARGWTLLWAGANGLDTDDMSMANLAGVFMGEEELGLSRLRDMAVRTSGPDKKKAVEAASAAISFIRERVFPILGARDL